MSPLAKPWFVTAAALALVLLSALASACGPDSSVRAKGGVTIEAVVSATVAAAPTGGKPAAPSDSATTEPAATATSEPAQTATDERVATAVLASDGSTAPTEGRWIDVDVTKFVVRLMNGTAATREISPVAVGEQVDTGEYASTQTGLFYVNSKIEDLAYDPPYDTYISHWVGFDLDKANGFHSFLKDKDGAVVDARTGRISNGCIRTSAPEVVFAFAEIGMPVWVHW
jgi:hypothetical protein